MDLLSLFVLCVGRVKHLIRVDRYILLWNCYNAAAKEFRCCVAKLVWYMLCLCSLGIEALIILVWYCVIAGVHSVRQEGVLFAIYMDVLIVRLRSSGFGCCVFTVCCLFWLPCVCWWHIVNSFCTVSAMRHMLMTCDLCRWIQIVISLCCAYWSSQWCPVCELMSWLVIIFATLHQLNTWVLCLIPRSILDV